MYKNEIVKTGELDLFLLNVPPYSSSPLYKVISLRYPTLKYTILSPNGWVGRKFSVIGPSADLNLRKAAICKIKYIFPIEIHLHVYINLVWERNKTSHLIRRQRNRFFEIYPSNYFRAWGCCERSIVRIIIMFIRWKKIIQSHWIVKPWFGMR